VVFSESGGLAVVDAAKGTVLWSRTEASLAAGTKAGPGNTFVAVDGARDRLYVVADRGARVLAFGLRDGAAVGELALPDAEARQGASYNVDGAYLDRAGGRLFVGAQVVSVPTLGVGARAEGVGKVFWADASRVLAIVAGSDTEPERLVELDPRTLAVRVTRPLVRTGMMRLNPRYDPVAKRVYAADMAEARVIAWEWPAR
jgi:outer membrane protein assembly factor BamB